MRKKIKLVIVTAIAVLVLGFINMNFSIVRNNYDSSLKLEDIKILSSALAEGGGITLDCWKTVSTGGTGLSTHKTYCGDCTAVLCDTWFKKSTCTN